MNFNIDKNRILDVKKMNLVTIESENTHDPDTLVHRLTRAGSQPIHRNYGLWIIGGGTGGRTIPDSFRICPKRYFEFYSISHMFDGRGKLWLAEGEQEYALSPGDCVLISPNTINRYGGAEGLPYVEDSIQFCGPIAEMLFHSGIIRDGAFPIGKVRRLLPIIQLLQDPAVDAQIRANIELQKLLVDLYLERRIAHNDYPQVERLIREIKSHIDRWWTVSEMSELCNMSDDQLRRVFVATTGMKPKLYVDQLKLKKAAEMLTGTRLKVSEIAEQLGYVDQYHFSRRFKKLMGVSPAKFRQSSPTSSQF